MPDTRAHRGAHPEDARDFANAALPTLRAACAELSFLLGHDYSQPAALKLVGDHHQLTARQRKAVMRGAASDAAVARRRAHQRGLEALTNRELAIDGFNCLITLESMLSQAPVFIGRDGAARDLASVHGTYRTVEETRPAVTLLARALSRHGVRATRVLLDRPVGNSGRLGAVFDEVFGSLCVRAEVVLTDAVDRELAASALPVASCDAFIIDRASDWLDLPSAVAHDAALHPWLVDLRAPSPP